MLDTGDLEADLATVVRTCIFRHQVDMFAQRSAAAVFHRWQQGSAPLDHAYADGVARRAVRALEVRNS